MEKHQRQEEYYRQAINEAIQDDNNLRDWARAKLELGYLLQSRGETEAADLAYLAAAQALERTPEESSHSLASSATRAGTPLWDVRCEIAPNSSPATLIASWRRPICSKRALAIHAYHGRTLQVAYCRTAAAGIDLASGRFADGIRRAMDAANDFESLKNWRAWAKAIEVLLDILAETRETTRMIALADFAHRKNRQFEPAPKAKGRPYLHFQSEDSRSPLRCWRYQGRANENGRITGRLLQS